MITEIVIFIFLYIIGSIPFSVLISKALKLPDPRTFGSKNPGATNMARSGNMTAATLTLSGDMLKGFLPAYVLLILNFQIEYVYTVSFIVLFGHIFSIFLKFRGGKAVATSLGIILAVDLFVGIALIIIWLSIYTFSRISALSALTSFTVLPFLFHFLTGNMNLVVISFLNTLIILITHSRNIRFLISKK